MLAGVTVVSPAVVSFNFILFMGSKTFVIGYIENISISLQALECILKASYIEYFTFNCKLFENCMLEALTIKSVRIEALIIKIQIWEILLPSESGFFKDLLVFLLSFFNDRKWKLPRGRSHCYFKQCTFLWEKCALLWSLLYLYNILR